MYNVGLEQQVTRNCVYITSSYVTLHARADPPTGTAQISGAKSALPASIDNGVPDEAPSARPAPTRRNLSYIYPVVESMV